MSVFTNTTSNNGLSESIMNNFQRQLPSAATATARTTQIIVMAMVMSLMTFMGVLLVKGNAGQGNAGLLTMIGAAMAGVLFVVRCVLPSMMVSAQRPQLAERLPDGPLEPTAEGQRDADSAAFHPLYGLFQTKTILAAALLEGPALLNLVAFMFEGHQISLIITGVLIALLLTLFPTAASVESWVEGEIAAIEQMRRF